MHRCVLPLCLAAALAAPAAAQDSRPFPPDALRGELVVVQPPDILLNGQAARLAPGARIRGSNNLLQMSASLAGQPLVVNYTVDPLGQLHNVWILSDPERARQPWPRTPEQAQRWRFDAAAQIWTQR